ncbi:MAG TPA: baseplate J/gp47 family protein, partial [Candidatus Angelobacter sp.]|nr:baseplate J/gp47 family protein [Candidatus Angelobacter sp.]
AYPSMEAYDRGTQVHQPEPVDPLGALAPAPPTAQAASGQGVSPRGVATLDRPRQASVVSAPPKKAPIPPKPPSTAPSLRSYRPYLIAAGILLVLGLIAAIVYMPTATATVMVSGTPIKQDVTLRGAVGNPTSGDQFATHDVHASESQNLPGTATGQKAVPAVAATGTVTFSLRCFLFCQATVPKGWIVKTESGKQYTTNQKVSLNGPSSSADSGVTAVTAGQDGNTDAGTIRMIQGNNDDSLSVTNKNALSNGADARTATVIQQSDIDSIKDAYARDAIQRIKDQLNSKAQGQELVLVGNGVQASVTADHKVGDEVSGFGVTVKVSGDGVTFDDKAAKGLLKSALQHKIPPGTQLTSNTKLTYEAIDAMADGHVTLNGHASGFYVPIFLESKLRSHLTGMSPNQAHALLQSQPNVVDARITQSPFGLPWLPLFASRISLKIQEVESPSSS